MSRLSLMSLYKERLFIYMLLSLLVIFGFNFFLNQMQVIKSDYTPTVAYYKGPDSEELTQELDQQGIEYGYGMIKDVTKGDKVFEKYQVLDSIDQEVNLRELKYIDQSTNDLASSNDSEILSGTTSQKFSMSYMLYPNFIGGTRFPIDSAATSLLSGSLPSTGRQIIIPENYALYLVNQDKTMKSYDDLIGAKVKLSKNGTEQEFKISAVASGNTFSIVPNEVMKAKFLEDNPNLGKAVYIKFKNVNQRNNFVNNVDINIQINTIWNYRNLVPLIMSGIKYVLQVLMNLLLIRYTLIIAHTLNHNYIRPGNYVLPWIVPFLIINGIYLVI